MSLPRRDWVALVVAVALAGGCVRLGFWQLARLGQRRARNALVRAARARPPLEVTGALTLDSARDRWLHAHGTYDFTHERAWHGRSYEGVPGVDLVTPLRLEGGGAVLVDRGWAPSPDGYHVDAGAYRESTAAEVLGLGVGAPRAPGDVSPGRLRDSVPYPLLPFILQEVPGKRATPAAGPRLARWPAPELTEGPHLAYAIQWFSFALIVLVGAAALVRQDRAGGARRASPPPAAA